MISMDNIQNTPLEHFQPEQAHESQSQPSLSPCSPDHLSSHSESMEPTPSTMPSITHPSDHPYPFSVRFAILFARSKECLAAQRAERRRKKEIQRLNQRLLNQRFHEFWFDQQIKPHYAPVQPTPVQSTSIQSIPIQSTPVQSTPIQSTRRRKKCSNRQKMKNNAAILLKKAGMEDELERAKKAAISPKHFPTINIHEDDHEHSDNDDDKLRSACMQMIIVGDSEIYTKDEPSKAKVFAGLIVIQDYLSAISQAISEHAKDNALATEPGRHSFYVDASVSSIDGLTGIAVVHKTDQQDWASEWIATGYRICEALDARDAEAWAIWQALRRILEKVYADRAIENPEDPCSVAVVYSDCVPALQGIEEGCNYRSLVIQKIINLSMELKQLGVDVHLHWVPGHRGVPGNELADLVSKSARRPVI